MFLDIESDRSRNTCNASEPEVAIGKGRLVQELLAEMEAMAEGQAGAEAAANADYEERLGLWQMAREVFVNHTISAAEAEAITLEVLVEILVPRVRKPMALDGRSVGGRKGNAEREKGNGWFVVFWDGVFVGRVWRSSILEQHLAAPKTP